MGTRGAIGFIQDGVEKVTYNHYDSYPSHLGKEMLEFCIGLKMSNLKKAVKQIVLVGDKEPTAEQITECRKFTNRDVSEKSTDDWYCLLRETQGNLKPYLNGLKYMIDNKDFLHDALFCEYAYLINLDTGKLEFYTGFNKDPKANGRYATAKADKMGYVGVALKAEFDLKSITKSKVKCLVAEMEKLSSDE
jgi:hypothetical protein